jgi:hypothetical protein
LQSQDIIQENLNSLKAERPYGFLLGKSLNSKNSRLQEGSITKPADACSHCGSRNRWIDNSASLPRELHSLHDFRATGRWFTCARLGSNLALVSKELGDNNWPKTQCYYPIPKFLCVHYQQALLIKGWLLSIHP